MNVNFETVNSEGGKNFLSILKGCLISIIITLLMLFVFSIILTYTSVSENVIQPVIIVLTAISIIIGSSISTSKIKKKGIINGGLIGAIYILLLYILSSFINGSFMMTTYSLIMVIAGLLAGMLRWDYWSEFKINTYSHVQNSSTK